MAIKRIAELQEKQNSRQRVGLAGGRNYFLFPFLLLTFHEWGIKKQHLEYLNSSLVCIGRYKTNLMNCCGVFCGGNSFCHVLDLLRWSQLLSNTSKDLLLDPYASFQLLVRVSYLETFVRFQSWFICILAHLVTRLATGSNDLNSIPDIFVMITFTVVMTCPAGLGTLASLCGISILVTLLLWN
jgi:hypothetical protein